MHAESDAVKQVEALLQSPDATQRDSGYERILDWDAMYNSPDLAQSEPLIDILIGNLEKEYPERRQSWNYANALFALNAVTKHLPIKRHDWSRLIAYLDVSERNEDKASILDVLGNTGKLEFVDVIKPFLDHPDPSVAESARISFDELTI